MDFVTQKHQEIVAELEPQISADAELQTLCQFQPVSPDAVHHGKDRGGNVMGLDELVADGAASTMFLFTAQVVTPEDEALVISYALDFIASIEEYAKSVDKYLDWKYLNYAYKTQDVIAAYGPEAVDLIKAAQAEYDPTLVFQKLRKSGFKVPA